MTIKTIIDLIILSLTFGFAFAAVGYEGYAQVRGWQVGERLAGSSLIKAVALLMLFVVLVIAFNIYSWWTPLVVLLFGFIFCFLSLQILKERMQNIAIWGVIIGSVLSLTYVLLVK